MFSTIRAKLVVLIAVALLAIITISAAGIILKTAVSRFREHSFRGAGKILLCRFRRGDA